MQQQVAFTKDEIAVWTWLVSRGIGNAMSGLSQMVGQELKVTDLEVRQFPAKQATSLLGGPENTVVGIYLTIEGDATGHLMLIHEPEIAYQLVDIQMEQPLGTTKSLGEMELSIMGEMGNITGSFFLNALADATNLTLTPSPPAVMVDMAGAILGIALSDIMQDQDDVLVVRTTFGTENQQVKGTFMVMPTQDFLRTMLAHSRTS